MRGDQQLGVGWCLLFGSAVCIRLSVVFLFGLICEWLIPLVAASGVGEAEVVTVTGPNFEGTDTRARARMCIAACVFFAVAVLFVGYREVSLGFVS